MCGQRLTIVEGLMNELIYLFRRKTLKVNIMEKAKNFLFESETNIKSH